MEGRFSRTELLFGSEKMKKLKESRVAVFGVGGVGGYVVEALVRSGIGEIDIIDNDVVSESNINRQIYALTSTVGRYKTDVAAERILDINPEVKVNAHRTFFMPETREQFDFSRYDYVVDAIDTVTGKIALVECCKQAGTPIICSMGAGNKLDPTRFEVADISETSVCPLAKVMRTELKKRNIKGVKTVYSKELPVKPDKKEPDGGEKSAKRIPASCAFVPSVVGLIIAGEVIKDLTKEI